MVPPELLSSILSEVANSYHITPTRELPLLRPLGQFYRALSSFCLVSRSWLPLGRAELYKHLDIQIFYNVEARNTTFRLDPLFTTLASHHHLRAYPRTAHVGFTNEDLRPRFLEGETSANGTAGCLAGLKAALTGCFRLRELSLDADDQFFQLSSDLARHLSSRLEIGKMRWRGIIFCSLKEAMSFYGLLAEDRELDLLDFGHAEEAHLERASRIRVDESPIPQLKVRTLIAGSFVINLLADSSAETLTHLHFLLPRNQFLDIRLEKLTVLRAISITLDDVASSSVDVWSKLIPLLGPCHALRELSFHQPGSAGNMVPAPQHGSSPSFLPNLTHLDVSWIAFTHGAVEHLLENSPALEYFDYTERPDFWNGRRSWLNIKQICLERKLKSRRKGEHRRFGL